MRHDGLAHVYSLEEVAQAVGADAAQVRVLAGAADYLLAHDALRIGRAIVAERQATRDTREAPLFSEQPWQTAMKGSGIPIALSGSLHVALLAILVVALGLRSTASTAESEGGGPPVHMVFLATPGPGGGGGGGGLRQKTAAPKILMKGRNEIASPAPPPDPAPVRQATPPAPSPSQPPQPIVAPVASAPNDARTRAGVFEEANPRDDSNGSGRGGGAGTGAGTGSGEGEGSGIGAGFGGGTGGGVYRPGSGITPPRVLREVKADYTEEARRRGLTGEVVLEIVVRRDGSVGAVKLLQGLGLGLDERAIAAVRQWRFAPAERFGTAVDVAVEVGVEFRLR